MKNGEGSRFNRRDFLIRVAGASVLALGAGGLCTALFDSSGPGPADDTKALNGLGNFARPELAGEKGKMAIVRGTDRALMLERGLQAVGGLESYIAKGDRVLLKCERRLRHSRLPGRHHAPGPPFGHDTFVPQGRCRPGAGYGQPHQRPGRLLRDVGTGRSGESFRREAHHPAERPLRPGDHPRRQAHPELARPRRGFPGRDESDRHGARKGPPPRRRIHDPQNFYGLLGGQRNVFHQGINDIITELSQLVKPDPRHPGRHSVHDDQRSDGGVPFRPETDRYVDRHHRPRGRGRRRRGTADRSPADVPYILMAQAAGAGLADYKRLNPVRIDQGA